MRPIVWIALAVVAAIAGFYGTVIAASETGEVVTLTTYDTSGTPHETRLWIVDHEDAEWLRTGHDKKGWYVRIGSNPRVELSRNGETSTRRAVPITTPEVIAAINEKFTEKYGSADWIVALSGDAKARIPVRLDPMETAPST